MASQIEREQLIAALANRGTCTQPLAQAEIGRGAHLCWSNAVSLLADVRLLVAGARPARSLSLTVLALEELAKPPMLFGVDPSDEAKRWAKFWKEEFSRHSLKQKVIGKYGDFLTSIGHEIYGFRLSAPTVAALEALKQWGFYVDCIEGAFQSPEDFAANLSEIVDLLFAVAEERPDRFGQFHASPEQSSWAYERRLKATRIGEFWPPPIRSEIELRAYLLSVASQYSLSNPPNYAAFTDACEQLSANAGAAMFDRALSAIGRVCSRRAQFAALPTAAARALLMMKLCLIVVPEAERSVTIQRWKESSPDVPPNNRAAPDRASRRR